MTKESLTTAIELIIDTLEKSNINTIDKVELMYNLSLFLKSSQYDNNIKILRKEHKKNELQKIKR